MIEDPGYLHDPRDVKLLPAVADLARRCVVVEAAAVGHWTIHFAEGLQRRDVGFSVNADPAESDLTEADWSVVESIFPPGRAQLASIAPALTHRRTAASTRVDTSLPLLLAMLSLMTGESFLANRFYRRTNYRG